MASTVTKETGRGEVELESLMVGETFADTRIADGEKFSRRKTLKVGPDADTTDADYGG
jgi:hypothetical protein